MTEVKKARNQIRQHDIDFYRPVCHKEVLDDEQKDCIHKYQLGVEKKKVKLNRQKLFLKQFKMFSCFSTEREKLLTAKQDPSKFFSCNLRWPLCRFDFAKEHTLVEEFVFRVNNFNDLEIFNDYFDPSKLNKRMNRKPQATTTKSLLIERG